MVFAFLLIIYIFVTKKLYRGGVQKCKFSLVRRRESAGIRIQFLYLHLDAGSIM